ELQPGGVGGTVAGSIGNSETAIGAHQHRLLAGLGVLATDQEHGNLGSVLARVLDLLHGVRGSVKAAEGTEESALTAAQVVLVLPPGGQEIGILEEHRAWRAPPRSSDRPSSGARQRAISDLGAYLALRVEDAQDFALILEVVNEEIGVADLDVVDGVLGLRDK